ncbi:3-oxoacyl-acyl-carrier-protein reductase [Cordyceps fumosorosea ARSEF 2679]|uniref:3-oxoacyl-acyl-carrier-protein reductase n=1 Tax=Cordyceps fumosorosea (strain ARSEF 2679) TaxID=1081104 RepID=A0A167YCJ2_CORFA|nr:3-oxoacyl-acyl-carrier-protein reductase [Cordyceps fumosorosea ARSEF 2679]OAA66166.1 3-oxoacyl-acyl-carrier-protein reductase [Cordyceps fumosorosea ARSEF 2679]
MSEAVLRDFPSLFSLKGKVAVVTGGSRGLGLHAASAFLQAGAAKVFISSRKAKACDEAVAALLAQPNLAPGAEVISVPADSSTLAGIKQLLAAVSAHTDHVDILFANAGATWGAPFDSHPDDAFAKVMDLNVRGVFNAIREFAPLLTRRATVRDPARVIITSSVAGLGVGSLGAHGTYGYSASKAAVLHLGRNLAVELGPRHVTVNSLCPGFFPSKMSNGLMEATGGAAEMAKGNPMRRLGEPEDIAGAVVYLASRAGAHVNGETLAVDGGSLWQRGEMLSAKL